MAYDGTFGQIFHRMIIALYAIYSRMAMVNTWRGRTIAAMVATQSGRRFRAARPRC